ncbi:glucosaminidase domain-containing protein [Mucilaginibacter sp. RS28]|uniref:Peptidoglycan hydrolase n=1 Tax=Mucilaginibacter straminoryzae TaxID=2932774 RepID=A0A9X1X3L4_9SPHI|nr:glucosaminidase domain-containing protein [Mucilaginibacter straminoryzae]MCJ8210622.1 glucosaminidase domain-containing protein [Mucilaginibacter straminoryzae]
MRKLIYLLAASSLLTSCITRRNLPRPPAHPSPSSTSTPSVYVPSNSEVEKNNDQIRKSRQGTYPTYTVYTYIDRFKAIAVQEMNTYGIPASITLAQGLFESGNGNGELAKYANNHFGIKCTSDWHGQSYYKNDDQINDCFRVYDSPEQSFRDHSEFLKRKRYAHLFELDKNDYQGWAQGLKDAGYATNPNYPQQLIKLIQKYNLDQFDRPESEIAKIKREDRVLSQINQNIPKETRDSVVAVTPANKLYTVVTGDTLYNISKRFGLTVDDLKALNNMTDNNIKIGQTLVISR